MSPTGVETEDKPIKLNKFIRSYPNPFSGETTIQFELDRVATASVTIYDVSGRVVKTLAVNRVWEAGSHALTWDGTSDGGSPVSSGRYFCEVSAPGVRERTTLVYLK